MARALGARRMGSFTLNMSLLFRSHPTKIR